MNKHGGAREGAGRPREIDGDTVRVQLTLDTASVKTLRELGLNNLSLGVREAARIIRQAGLTNV